MRVPASVAVGAAGGPAMAAPPRRGGRRGALIDVACVCACALLLFALLVGPAAAVPVDYRRAGGLHEASASSPYGGSRWVIPLVNGTRMISKTVGTEFYVRTVQSDGSPGDFAPFGFIAGINIGASKPYHDPGELPLTFDDYFRVRPPRPCRTRRMVIGQRRAPAADGHSATAPPALDRLTPRPIYRTIARACCGPWGVPSPSFSDTATSCT
jgi:hypothetical protein